MHSIVDIGKHRVTTIKSFQSDNEAIFVNPVPAKVALAIVANVPKIHIPKIKMKEIKPFGIKTNLFLNQRSIKSEVIKGQINIKKNSGLENSPFPEKA